MSYSFIVVLNIILSLIVHLIRHVQVCLISSRQLSSGQSVL
jgi:hypothetical protein